MTFKTYLDAIKTNIDRDVIQLKRNPWETRINNYNATILAAWRANCDIQYITDPFACLVYILNYITKCEKESTNAINQLNKEMVNKNLTLISPSRK